MLVVVLTIFLLTVKDQISSKHLVAAHFWGFVLSPNIILVYTDKRYILFKWLTIHISSIGFLQPFVHYFLPLAKFPPCLYHTQLLVPFFRVPFFFYLGRRTPIFILPPIISNNQLSSINGFTTIFPSARLFEDRDQPPVTEANQLWRLFRLFGLRHFHLVCILYRFTFLAHLKLSKEKDKHYHTELFDHRARGNGLVSLTRNSRSLNVKCELS